jgi:protein gp37
MNTELTDKWWDKSWNITTGCTQISTGCDNCYAKRIAETRLRGRFGYPEYAPFAPTWHKERTIYPVKWAKPRIIFVSAMGDLFHRQIFLKTIASIWETMAIASQHLFIILTKRPKRMLEFIQYWSEIPHRRAPEVLPNVIIGVTVENQAMVHKRIPILMRTPAAARFVSAEPLLTEITLRGYFNDHEWVQGVPGGIDWVICGAETGPNAREMNPT